MQFDTYNAHHHLRILTVQFNMYNCSRFHLLEITGAFLQYLLPAFAVLVHIVHVRRSTHLRHGTTAVAWHGNINRCAELSVTGMEGNQGSGLGSTTMLQFQTSSQVRLELKLP